jgi:hypothetical protein
MRKLRGLSSIDPTQVVLPNGTEVTTRVARAAGERTIPESAVGRVVGSDGEWVEVRIVGGGVVRYLRDELVPRKAGQQRFAVRRAEFWEALRPCAVLEATVGSRAWGLAEESSDTDTRGVFVLPFPWTISLAPPPEDLVSSDGSHSFWEAEKTIRQGLRGDPNTLETLFVPSVRATDEMGEWILSARDAFVSAEIYGTFGRYALSQLKKLVQSLRLAEHRALLVDWLRAEPALALDELAARLARATAIEDPAAKEFIKQLYRSMFDQGLLDGSDLAALARYARGSASELEIPRELRPKNAYNLLRLIALAIGWLRDGAPRFLVEGELRARLLAVKHGQVPLDDVLREAEAMTALLEAARQATKLPARADVTRADALLRKIRETAARRFTDGNDGPFGKQAPPFPAAAWEDHTG